MSETVETTELRRLIKEKQKLQQQLNRISNLMIGNTRIWELDRIAMELEVEAELLMENLPRTDPLSLEQIAELERAEACRKDAVFLRRIEYDLGELHVAVKGDTNRRGGRYDQSNWRGERP